MLSKVSAYGLKYSEEGNGENGACGAAGCLENDSFAEVDGVAFGLSFGHFGVSVLDKLTDRYYELGGG